MNLVKNSRCIKKWLRHFLIKSIICNTDYGCIATASIKIQLEIVHDTLLIFSCPMNLLVEKLNSLMNPKIAICCRHRKWIKSISTNIVADTFYGMEAILIYPYFRIYRFNSSPNVLLKLKMFFKVYFKYLSLVKEVLSFWAVSGPFCLLVTFFIFFNFCFC